MTQKHKIIWATGDTQRDFAITTGMDRGASHVLQGQVTCINSSNLYEDVVRPAAKECQSVEDDTFNCKLSREEDRSAGDLYGSLVNDSLQTPSVENTLSLKSQLESEKEKLKRLVSSAMRSAGKYLTSSVRESAEVSIRESQQMGRGEISELWRESSNKHTERLKQETARFQTDSLIGSSPEARSRLTEIENSNSVLFFSADQQGESKQREGRAKLLSAIPGVVGEREQLERRVSRSMSQMVIQRGSRSRSSGRLGEEERQQTKQLIKALPRDYISPYSQRSLSASRKPDSLDKSLRYKIHVAMETTSPGGSNQTSGCADTPPCEEPGRRPKGECGIGLSTDSTERITSRNIRDNNTETPNDATDALGAIEVVTDEGKLRMLIKKDCNPYVEASRFISRYKLDPILIEPLAEKVKLLKRQRKSGLSLLEGVDLTPSFASLQRQPTNDHSLGDTAGQTLGSITRMLDSNINTSSNTCNTHARSLSGGKKMSGEKLRASVERLYRGVSPTKRQEQADRTVSPSVASDMRSGTVSWMANNNSRPSGRSLSRGNNPTTPSADRQVSAREQDQTFSRLFEERRDRVISRTNSQDRLASSLLTASPSLAGSGSTTPKRAFTPDIDAKSRQLSKVRWEAAKEKIGESGNFGAYYYDLNLTLEKIKHEKIERDREEKLKKELEPLRDVPQISKHKSNICGDLERNILKKFDRYERRRQDELETKRRNLEKAEKEAAPFKPTILRGPANRSRDGRVSPEAHTAAETQEDHNNSTFEVLFHQAKQLDTRRKELLNQQDKGNTHSPNIGREEKREGAMARINKMLSDWKAKKISAGYERAEAEAMKAMKASGIVYANEDTMQSGVSSSFLKGGGVSVSVNVNEANRSRSRGMRGSVYDNLYEDASDIEMKRVRLTLQETLKDRILSNVVHINDRSNRLVTESRKSIITDVFCVIAQDGVLKLGGQNQLNLDDIPNQECQHDIRQALAGIKGEIDVFGFCYLMETYLESCPIPRLWLKRM